MLVQRAAGIGERDAFGHRDRILGHHVPHAAIELRLEADVAAGEDADGLSVLHHGQTREAVRVHELERVAQRGLRLDRDRIDDHAALRLLDAPDLAGLLLDGQVLVQHTEAAVTRHDERGGGLGHRVHRGVHERHPQLDVAGQSTADIDLMGKNLAVPRLEEHVVERQGFADVPLHGGVRRPSARVGEAVTGPPTLAVGSVLLGSLGHGGL